VVIGRHLGRGKSICAASAAHAHRVTITLDAGDLLFHAELANRSWDDIAARLLLGKVSGCPFHHLH
jgi:hypothetical protein